MSLRPPDPTTNHLSSKAEAQKHRKAAIIPVAVGLVAIVLLAGTLMFRQSQTVETRTYHTGTHALSADLPGDMPMDMFDQGMPMPFDGMDHEPANVMRNPVVRYSAQTSLEELLTFRQPDNILGDSPLDINPHPQGQRLAGFSRAAGDVVDDIMIWKVDVSNPSEALTHFLNAAADRYFVALPQPPASKNATPGVISHVLIRKQAGPAPAMKAVDHDVIDLPPGNDVMVVRGRPTQDGQVIVTLWYRHAIPNNKRLALPR